MVLDPHYFHHDYKIHVARHDYFSHANLSPTFIGIFSVIAVVCNDWWLNKWWQKLTQMTHLRFSISTSHFISPFPPNKSIKLDHPNMMAHYLRTHTTHNNNKMYPH